jgi:hypothetical protein
MVRPLTNLLHHKTFVWTDSAQSAFDQLKKAMISTPVLAFPHFSKEFVVETDACETEIAAVLSQEGHPLAYFSKGLSVNNQKLSTYEKEFLAVLMAVDKWRCYLHRNPFVIKTNHQSLCHLQDQTLSTDLQKRAMRKLVGLQFRFSYKKGSENKVADALSGVGMHFDFNAVSAVVPIWIQEVLNSNHTDAEAVSMLQQLVVASPNGAGYSLVDGVIKYKTKIWIGNNTALQTKLITVFRCHLLHGRTSMCCGSVF